VKELKLKLGETEYTIKPLTCGQIEDIEEAVGAYSGGAAVRLSKQTNRTILAVALSVDYPDVTAESIKSVRLGTQTELARLVTAILDFGGFLPKKREAGASGETAAGAG
jgi:hypothetical protein